MIKNSLSKNESGRVLIINADDFGYDKAHTLGVEKAFEDGLISNTTIMVNMPFFEEARTLCEERGFKDRVGLHLNLVEGLPLTEDIRSCATFCDKNGILHGEWRESVLKTSHLNRREQQLLKEESLAQFELYEKSGFTQKHFDTHGHAHTYFSVWYLLKRIMKEYGYHYSMRIAKNLYDDNSSGIKKAYKNTINRVYPKDICSSDYFTDIKGFIKNVSEIKEKKAVEIMCHPYLENGKIINPDDLQFFELQEYLSGWEIISF